MEGFDLISAGAWSLVPPILALTLALVTKEVYSSLLAGVFSGMLIYQTQLNGFGTDQVIDSFVMVPQMMIEQLSGNAALVLFLALLGALVAIIAISGGSRAYGEWVAAHVKNARLAQLMTALLGVIIFVDDYFNCLTVGAVMSPVTDRFRVSREKLAWIIDSTAAPICIIAPVSSWAVAVGGYLGDGGFTTFVESIPYNFYALVTIVFVVFMCLYNKDFGPMKKAQDEATFPVGEKSSLHNNAIVEKMNNDLKSKDASPNPSNLEVDGQEVPTMVAAQTDVSTAVNAVSQEDFKGIPISSKGRTFDLVIPIFVLIVFSILGMLFAGGFFEGVEFGEAVGANPVLGLCIGSFVGLLVAAFLYIPRKLTSLTTYMEGFAEGVRSMVGAITILVFAWSLGGTCRYLLGTGIFVSDTLNSIGVGLELLPAIIFLVAAFIGFAMGTSWGTIALILPIVVGVFPESDPLFLVAVGAALGGAVYGDHISPISDTTILSSAGAGCDHLRHVTTQIPYASAVMIPCFIGYIVAGFVGSPWIPLIVSTAIMIICVLMLTRKNVKQSA